MHRESIATRVGQLWATVEDDGYLVELLLPRRSSNALAAISGSTEAARTFERVKSQLEEYFAGTRRVFDVPLRLNGSPFERRVWERLLAIPYGETTSYGAIAEELQLINGARAVGRANGDNPIPIIVPCHRVIGANGKLVGYGGGLPLKRALLELENAAVVAQMPLLTSSV